MIQKIKNLALAIMLPLTMAAPLALAPAASAADIGGCSGISESVNQGLNSATGNGQGCGDAYGAGQPTSLASIAKTIVNILSVIVGVVAVIMIIVGGFRYITSGGDSGNVSSAKNTLIYAIVGLIIVALAHFILHFVLTNVIA